MKNKYEIHPNYILTLENEELRKRIMELSKKFNELKKIYEAKKRERVLQASGNDEII